MKPIHTLACLSLVSLMTACAPAGYYDSNGEYRSYGKSDSFRHDNAMSGTPDTTVQPEQPMAPATTTIIYDRRGYYDNEGEYVDTNEGPVVPGRMFPPRGMCRIWYEDTPAREQPPVESCEGIRDRVPEGAYVVYGG